MKTIVCSHGFGVDATDRGLFSDIAAAFPEYTFAMFDYNAVDENGNVTVLPIEQQAELLNTKLKDAGGEIILLCHSQGCVTAAMADVSKVSSAIFLAPPENLDIERFVKIFGSRAGTQFNPEGLSSIPRHDGTSTYIGKEYLESIGKLDVQALFAQLAKRTKLDILRASEDEVVGNTTFPGVDAAVQTLVATHNFDGASRPALIDAVGAIIKT